MNFPMSDVGRKLLCAALALAFAFIAPESLAQQKKKKKGAALGEAVVHVLDPGGAPVGGIEVILDVERPDGSHDRRLGLTGEDGDAHFRDVRGDCVHVRASVRTESADVEGQPRPCGAKVEAFVVVPAAAVAPANVEGPVAAEPPGAGIAEQAEHPVPAEVEEDPYAASEPAATAPKVAPEAPPETPPEEQPYELRGRFGPDFCVEMLYDPAEKQRTCDDTSPVGLGIELDAAFHFEEWFLVGVTFSYRYFGSQIVPIDAPEDDPSKEAASNHLIMAGLQLRFSWMLENWVLAVDGVPLGISHQVIALEGDQVSLNEFYVTLTLSGGYRVGKGSWVGAYIEAVQLMPWVHSDIFRPAAISVGVLFGTRLGPDPEPVGETAKPDADKGDSSTSDALMRRVLGDI